MSEEVRICTSCWEEDCVCDYEQYAFLDSGIADIVVTLNLKGYKTIYCCEGHISPDDGTGRGGVLDIYLEHNYRLDTLPEGFAYPRGKQHTHYHHTVLYKYAKGKLLARINGKYIPYDLEQDRIEHLEKLRVWAESLPEVDIKKHHECYSEYMVTGKPKVSYLKWELPLCKTFKVLIEKDRYDAVAERIIGYSGKVLDVEERDEKLLVSYWSQSDLFDNQTSK